jgi:hypothetical protein
MYYHELETSAAAKAEHNKNQRFAATARLDKFRAYNAEHKSK